MKKHWPIIKLCLYRGYVGGLVLLIVANAYMERPVQACFFIALFALDLLDGGLEKIATAIRTQRNFHIIGDANEIKISGSTLYADNVSVRDRQTHEGACQ